MLGCTLSLILFGIFMDRILSQGPPAGTGGFVTEFEAVGIRIGASKSEAMVLCWKTAHAELIFRRLSETQTLQLSHSPQKDHGVLMGLHLYHRSANSQTTLLSMSEDCDPKVDPGIRGRLQLRGGLNSHQVYVNITGVEPGDTGLYMWERSYRWTNGSEQIFPAAQKVFLLVEGHFCHCSPSHSPLLITIFAAAGLLLLAFSWLAVDKCVKSRPHHKPQPPAPIYEEMTRKQQNTTATQNNSDTPLHLEEINFPVYANPNIRQQQDNYYACPRQLALRA
ncbi:uncharacterized protein LOC121503950 [Cheilinus undulatus]|uniref:uncharacterized protein LOC121503950 n=1 Tax=Cheilinus undulatus TaxID=241271 RepID=UPI001BD383B5|nr:uncharacterized protein LOC121503950 [Cheilinus undulatus]